MQYIQVIKTLWLQYTHFLYTTTEAEHCQQGL